MGKTNVDPHRGETWWVRFDEDAVEQEILKTRPAVVIGANALGMSGLRIIVPVTTMQAAHKAPWFVKLPRSQKSGLSKDSCADCSQVKSVSVKRFEKKLGAVAASQLKSIVAAVALSIDYTPGE